MQMKHRHKQTCIRFVVPAILVYIVFETHSRSGKVGGLGSASSTFLSISPLLEHILICITFHWNLKKIVYLERMLELIGTYKSHVDVLIVTNEAAKLEVVLTKQGFTNRIRSWQAPINEDGEDVNPFNLLWAHKIAIKDATASHNYTSIVYMEDDTFMSWASLVSWALDTEVLEPLNFTRCFYRTELSPETGESVMLDWIEPYILHLRRRPLDASLSNPSHFNAVSGRVARKACRSMRDGLGTWELQVHRHFLSPIQPFQGMWIATPGQLAAYMASPYWEKEIALSAEIPFPFGYAERSNSLNILVNVPTGFISSCMVPYLPMQQFGHPILVPEAEIYHMRNGYSVQASSPHGKLKVQEALLP